MIVFVKQFENSNYEEHSQRSLEYEPMQGSRDKSLPVEMCYSNEKSFLKSRKEYYTKPLENPVLLPSEGAILKTTRNNILMNRVKG